MSTPAVETGLARVTVVDGQLVVGQELQLALGTLRQRAEGLVVSSKETSTEAKQIAKDGRDDINLVIAAAEPERLRRKRELDSWVADRDKIVAEFATVIDPLTKAAREYDIAEVNAAQAEQADLNHGQRAENRVSVKPNVEAVAGTRFVPKYRCTVLNAAKVARKWLTPDIKAIEGQARKDKNPAQTEKAVGGVRITRE